MKAAMVVSARVDPRLRQEVVSGARPTPEYLVLERDYGLRLVDWSSLGGTRSRSVATSMRHAAAALEAAGSVDAIFSDGEHVGIPLGLALRTLGPARPHVMLGHHLTSRSKPLVLRLLGRAGITRVLLHSRTQVAAATLRLGFGREQVAFVPYFADATFWRPINVEEQPIVVSAGREHRDFATLASATARIGVRTVIAAGSLFSPRATWRMPAVLPPNISVGVRSAAELRDLYGAAAVVVVPLVDNDFQAGVTTILEAMAMAKPVIVTATEGQRDIVADGVTGVQVAPGDTIALETAIRALLADAHERQRLGANARDAVLRHYDLPGYSATLHRHLVEVAQTRRAA